MAKRPPGPALTPRQQLAAPFPGAPAADTPEDSSTGPSVQHSTGIAVEQSTDTAVAQSNAKPEKQGSTRKVASYKVEDRVRRAFQEYVKRLNRDRPVDAELETGAVAQRALAAYMTTYPAGEPDEAYSVAQEGPHGDG